MDLGRAFASDNNAGVHPEVLAALAAANVGHAPAYGDDAWTARAVALLRREFGAAAQVHFVFGGTAANVLGLAALVKPHQAVLCSRNAHIAVHECGAPERFGGCKLVLLDDQDGKLSPAAVERELGALGDVHRSQPRVVSISQCTELGTVYTPAELRALSEHAHARGLLLHVDGARIANAAAALGVGLGAITTDVGVDVLSLGGTKNGLLGAEAVVFPRGNPPGTAAADFEFLRKAGLQLASKMRFLAVQFEALFTDGLWLRSAERANRAARHLAELARGVPGVELTRPVETNAVFARLPRDWIEPLQQAARFYVWDEPRCEVRWVTSFDTTDEDVERFAAALRQAPGRAAGRK